MSDPVYRLKVGGATVPAALRVSVTAYEASFDGPAQLTLRCDCDWTAPPWPAAQTVEFFVDGVRRFAGLTSLPQPYVDDKNRRWVEYECLDLADHAARLFPKNFIGDPDNEIYTYGFTLNPAPLAQVLAQYLALPDVASMFDRCGIDPAPLYSGGAQVIECFPVSLDAQSIDSAMRAIAAAAPGVACILDCTMGEARTKPAYRFVNLYGTEVHDLNYDAVRVERLAIKASLEGRCGAVVTQSGETVGTGDFSFDQHYTLSPAWNRSPIDPDDPAELTLEDFWSFTDAAAVDQAGQPTERAKVFRLFSFADAADPPSPDSMLTVEQRVYQDPDDPALDIWRPVRFDAPDYEQMTVLLKEPALRPGIRTAEAEARARAAARFNIHEPGRCKGKECAVRLSWLSGQSGRAIILIPGLRYPASGYSGRAAQLDPLRGRTERIITIPAGVNRAQYVQFAHAQLSEPKYEGEIPLYRALPSELWPMDRRVNVVCDTGATGYEALRAPMAGISIDFENGGMATVQLSRDTTETLKEGAA